MPRRGKSDAATAILGHCAKARDGVKIKGEGVGWGGGGGEVS